MTQRPTLRTAVVQFDVMPQDIEANLARHLDFIEQARAEGVQVLVFPELSLTGYRLRSPVTWAPEYGGAAPPFDVLPQELKDVITRHRERPAGRFALRIYREYRNTPAAG